MRDARCSISSIEHLASSIQHQHSKEHIVNPDKLLFAKTHEWVATAEEGGQKIATMGLTDFAVQALTDLVFIELPKVGCQVKAEESFAEVESVKAVSDVYSPVTGEVIAVNESLPDHLETLSSDPYGKGWIAKLKVTDDSSLKKLMNHAAYQKQCAEEAH
jgi:glycine cleavage system H protein